MTYNLETRSASCGQILPAVARSCQECITLAMKGERIPPASLHYHSPVLCITPQQRQARYALVSALYPESVLSPTLQKRSVRPSHFKHWLLGYSCLVLPSLRPAYDLLYTFTCYSLRNQCSVSRLNHSNFGPTCSCKVRMKDDTPIA